MCCSRCCCRGPAVEFRMYHAGGAVFCFCCNGQIPSPIERCSQTKSGELKNAKSPPSGVADG